MSLRKLVVGEIFEPRGPRCAALESLGDGFVRGALRPPREHSSLDRAQGARHRDVVTAIEASQLGQPRDVRRAPLKAVCYLGNLHARVEESENATFDGSKLGLHDHSLEVSTTV